jgi:hypothetical protein
LAVRVIDAHHDACGASTRVRLPGTLSPRAVRRFHCAGCAAAFEAQRVEEIELRLAGGAEAAISAPIAPPAPESAGDIQAQPEAMEARAVEALTRAPKRKVPIPKLSLPKLAMPKVSLPKVSMPKVSMPKVSAPKLASLRLPKINPESRSWKLASIGIAAVLVVAILLALNGGDDQPAPVLPPPPASEQAAVTEAPAAADTGDRSASGSPAAQGSKKTEFVHESSFSLALPKGWERVDPPAGATFAAVAADGGADATLWITQDPKLDFPTFIKQSLAQLETLAGSARIVERVPAPTAEGTVVRIAADAPAGQPTYEATLRVAGPYRYYLATTAQPDTSAETADGVELITGSLTPELEG